MVMNWAGIVEKRAAIAADSGESLRVQEVLQARYDALCPVPPKPVYPRSSNDLFGFMFASSYADIFRNSDRPRRMEVIKIAGLLGVELEIIAVDNKPTVEAADWDEDDEEDA